MCPCIKKCALGNHLLASLGVIFLFASPQLLLALLSRILEREVLRSEQEFERAQAEAEVDAKRAADAVEDFSKKHEEV